MASGDPPAQSLSLAAGLALIEAVEAVAPGLPLLLKWPNDLLVGGAKAAGILLERQGERVVIGFGVNLAAAPDLPDRPAAHLGGRATPRQFAQMLAAAMAQMLVLWRTASAEAFAQAWLARAHPVATELTVHVSDDEAISGWFHGIAADGTLKLRLPDGSIRHIHAADVEL